MQVCRSSPKRKGLVMIAVAIIHKIRLMLDEGTLSQRKIASQLGVSRGTVNAVALGKRRDRATNHEENDDFTPPSGLPQRCHICGALVQMPCLACRVRSLKSVRKNSQPQKKPFPSMIENRTISRVAGARANACFKPNSESQLDLITELCQELHDI